MTYADIIVDISHEKLDKSFRVSGSGAAGRNGYEVGMVVSDSLSAGRNHVRKGYVVGLSRAKAEVVDGKLDQSHCRSIEK